MKMMKLFTILCTLLAVTLFADYNDSEVYKKTLKFPDASAENHLEIDNINGWVEVEGYDGDEIIIEVEKIIRADSKRDLEKGMKEAKLGIEEEGRFIRIFDDGPWHDKNYDWDDLDYEPEYNFKVKVPENVELTAGTVNGKYVIVNGVKGNFRVSNVNGRIEMYGAEGSGKATTVNGKVIVEFNKSPKEDCTFKTINGEVNVTFPEDLNADISCKTLNGDVYTDFEVSYSTSREVDEGREGGKYVYHSDNSLRIKIGDGGPVFKMSTINGDISIPMDK